MSRLHKELRLILNDDENYINDITLNLIDGSKVNIGFDRIKIIECEYNNTFNINLSKAKISSFMHFANIMNFYADSMLRAKNIKIDLSYNNISNNLFENIVNYLFKYRTKLVEIDVSNNNIQVNGLKLLFNLIENSPKFCLLKCDNNFFTKESFELVKHNSSLNEILKERINFTCYNSLTYKLK